MPARAWEGTGLRRHVTVTTKLKPGLPPDVAWHDVQALYAWRPVVIRPPIMDRARAIQVRYAFSWWDALVVSAAAHAECSVLLTEDLQDGQSVDGLTVVNPFLHAPTEIIGR